MRVNEDKRLKTEIVLDTTRSMDSTTIMANTQGSRQKKASRLAPIHNNNSGSFEKSAGTEKKKKERASLLDRLTIVNVETSSTTKKKKGRRKHDRAAPRNHKPLPEELLVQQGLPDSVSMIPDSFSNTQSNEEEEQMKYTTYDQVPTLFTFDLVPSFSEDVLCKAVGEESCSTDNDTTDANIGDEEDDISRIFDEFEESDDKCVKDLEEKYSSNKNTTDTNATEPNTETLMAMSKLELKCRTRTASTEFLSEVSSNDASTQLEKEPVTNSKCSKPDARLHDEASLVGHYDLHKEASRCTFNIFSMFD